MFIDGEAVHHIPIFHDHSSFKRTTQHFFKFKQHTVILILPQISAQPLWLFAPPNDSDPTGKVSEVRLRLLPRSRARSEDGRNVISSCSLFNELAKDMVARFGPTTRSKFREGNQVESKTESCSFHRLLLRSVFLYHIYHNCGHYYQSVANLLQVSASRVQKQTLTAEGK